MNQVSNVHWERCEEGELGCVLKDNRLPPGQMPFLKKYTYLCVLSIHTGGPDCRLPTTPAEFQLWEII